MVAPMLDHSLRILAAAAAVGFVLVALRVRSGAARHAAWSAVLAAMLTMPVLTSIVPGIEVPVPSRLAFEPGTVARQPGADNTGSEPIPIVDSSAASATSSPQIVVPRDQPHAEIVGGFDWTVAIPVLYVGGLMFLGVRVAAGWMAARRLVRASLRTGLAARAPVVESAAVAAPLTAGVLSPVIVLPLGWRRWPAETLRAALAHEDAHVARRDGLVLLLAHVNRAIFWFHPLAWWLTRTIAITAEHACDERVVRAIGEPRRYAEILVEMARAVSRRRSRIAWAAAGIDGSGHLGARVDRLLRGDALQRMSMARRLSTAAACAVVLIAAIACRQQIAAAPLRPDPDVTKRLADTAARTKMLESSRDMPEAEVDALEARVAADPQDRVARERLVIYYTQGTHVPWDRKVPGLRRHALWLIEHAPEHEIAPPPLSPDYDPEGFAAAVRLWDAQLRRPDASPFLVHRAAQFYFPYDKPRAEQLILRGMEIDPQSERLRSRMPPNVGGYSWPSQLASLYATALAGARGIGTGESSGDLARSPFAQKVRRKLDASRDADLLARVGSEVVTYARFRRPPAQDVAAVAERDRLDALGRSYVRRAAELSPTSDVVRRVVENLDMQDRRQRASRAIRTGGTVSDEDRLEYLALNAQESYSLAEFQTDYRKDAAAAQRKIDEARKGAEEVLAIAARVPASPRVGGAVMTAHQTLGLVALREGSRSKAVEHMRQSVAIDAIDPHADYGLAFRLAAYLLKAGERQSVADYFERYAQLAPWRKDMLLREAAAIRDGRMPETYQRMFAAADRRARQ